MDKRKLENKAIKKPKKAKIEKVIKYVTTANYPCLSEGVEIAFKDKAKADTYIKKGYVKIKD